MTVNELQIRQCKLTNGGLWPVPGVRWHGLVWKYFDVMLESGHGAVVYCISLNICNLYWKSDFFFFSSSLRENTMCGGVKVLKNKNMSIFIISKENSLSGCGGLNGCAFVYSQLWSKPFWKWHIQDTQSLGKRLSVYQEHESKLLRIEVMRLQSRTECTPELGKPILAFTSRVEYWFQRVASFWLPWEKIFSKSISDSYLSNSYSYMETSKWTGISKILEYEHICAFNTCLEISDQAVLKRFRSTSC